MKDIPFEVSADDRISPGEDEDDLPKAFRRSAEEAEAGRAAPVRVVITDFDISYTRMAHFAIKLTLAILPAFAVLWLVLLALAGITVLAFYIARYFGVGL